MSKASTLKPVNVGVVGCGNISTQYLSMAKNFPVLNVAACADLNRAAAEAQAQKFGVPRVAAVDELMKDGSIDVILNLTVPKAHAPVSLQAIEGGKHVYTEKPLAIVREEGRKVLDAGKRRNLRVGCAPDTFMGTGFQTARQVLDAGAIGKPIAFTAFMLSAGPERWHPSPEFLYEKGGGPMLDMGPYYLTWLYGLFGPIKRLTGAAAITIPERVIGSGPKAGKRFRVETPDLVAGTIEYENGAVGTIMHSYATMHAPYEHSHPITIYGTEATMKVPDPNAFDGPVLTRRLDDAEWKPAESKFVAGYGRAVGLADMAYAIRSGRPHRASGELGFAVLDAMQGFLDSAESGRPYTPTAKFERPPPMPTDLPFGTLDA